MPAINLTATTYTQNFNTLASSGSTSSSMPTGWEFLETGSNANTTYGINNGSLTTGNTYSYGANSNTERSLGGLPTGNLTPSWGVSFTNNTGGAIGSLAISYRGEQWRLGTIGQNNKLDFQYSLNATSLATGTWTDFNSLDFSSPVRTGTVGPLNGNISQNNTNFSTTISGLNIANGQTFYLRWQNSDIPNADNGLAIDNFALTPNVAPSDLTLSNTSINENVADNVVGNFTSTDANTGDTFSYSLVAGTGDTDNTAFTISSGQLLINAPPDFEAQSTYDIRVRTTDSTGLSYDKPLTIKINDVNETPTDLGLSPSNVDENVLLNTIVGNFSSTDPDTGDTFTYSLVTDPAYPDNSAFTISASGQLKTNTVLDFETKLTYNILVRTTDAGGLSYDQPLTVDLNDIDEFIYGTPNNDLLQGTAGSDQIKGLAGSDRLYGNVGNDTIDGGDGNDIVYGGNNNDLLNGGNGSDRLYGDAGNDAVYGDAGNDVLYGGNGDDLLDGGAGSDLLYGNGGIDTFVLASGMGQDSIYNFQDGIDKIQLNGLAFADLLITQSGANTLIKELATGVTIGSLINTSSTLIGADDFTFSENRSV
ncbi:MAG: cadherin domain-containing protein [Planktothrix sp. GU0601_MAG3]|nr:MAG: cadherin domain-containing protein [Planktothrix sp. GU0601_MAG3]